MPSVQNSGPDSAVKDPIEDASETYWKHADIERLADVIPTYLTGIEGDQLYYRKNDIDISIANAVAGFLIEQEIQDRIDAALINATGFTQAEADDLYYQRAEVDSLITSSNSAFLTETEILQRISDARFLTAGVIAAYPDETPPSGWFICDGSALSRTEYADLFTVLGIQFGNGDGSTTFNIPNYRGRFLVGKRVQDTIGNIGGSRTTILTGDQIPSHIHVISSHGHSFGSHSHGGGSHSHSISSHSHSVSSHSHGGISISSHAHSIPSHSHGYARPTTQGSTYRGTIIGTNFSGSETLTTGSGSVANSESGGSHSGTTGSAGGGNTGNGSSSTNSSSSSTGSGGPGSTGSAGGSATLSEGGGQSHDNMPPYRVMNWIIKS